MRATCSCSRALRWDDTSEEPLQFIAELALRDPGLESLSVELLRECLPPSISEEVVRFIPGLGVKDCKEVPEALRAWAALC